MAEIKATTEEKIVKYNQFKGLHESPDGDNKLKDGEATVCKNFKITADGSLKKRPGSKMMYDIAVMEGVPVRGMWNGYASGHEIFVAACNGSLHLLYDDGWLDTLINLGDIETVNDVSFVPYESMLYILTGVNMYRLSYDNGWVLENMTDGNHGYRPLVEITLQPLPLGGELYEEVNKLNGLRRVWLSPNGTGKTFKLPEPFNAIDYVTDLETGLPIPDTDYTYDGAAWTITFNEAPPLRVDSIEVGYSVLDTFADTVGRMRYAELYAGTQDTRIFAYGDGTNEAFYTGIDYLGVPRGDYWPDLYEVAVGDANTPITAMIRHYSMLIAYKTNSAYSISYGITTLADETLTPSFYTTPMNRIIGNEALGQVYNINNSPRTLCQGNCYEWHNNASPTSNLSMDERQAKRISDRIFETLGTFNLSECHCYDDNLNGEYFIIYNGNALVHNYVADAWYYYDSLDMYRIIEFHREQYIGTIDGRILHLSDDYTNDSDVAIDCLWESGAMNFGLSYMRKYSAILWLGIKPELNNELMVTVKTDRSDENTIISVEPEKTTELPQVKRCKVKVKKFTHYKLVLRSQNLYSRMTLVEVEIRVRYTSYAK